MAFVEDSTTTALSVNSTLAKAQRWVSNWFMPPQHSPEHDLLSSTVRDMRLLPRVPMTSEQIDVGTLAAMSAVGMRRAKLVTDASHPELMQAWRIMSQRAGLAKVPQLVIAESEAINAMSVTDDEVILSTGMLKVLDLRETTAVLGHELRHLTADHLTPRVQAHNWMAVAGVLAGNEIGRHHPLGRGVAATLGQWQPTRGIANWLSTHVVPHALVSRLAFISLGLSAGAMLANQISVKPGELDSDKHGAELSGDPQGLAMALQVLKQHAPPETFGSTWRRWKSGYPTLDKRIENLQRMPQGVPVVSLITNAPHAVTPQTDAPLHVRTPEDQPRAAVQMATSERLAAPLSAPALT